MLQIQIQIITENSRPLHKLLNCFIIIGKLFCGIAEVNNFFVKLEAVHHAVNFYFCEFVVVILLIIMLKMWRIWKKFVFIAPRNSRIVLLNLVPRVSPLHAPGSERFSLGHVFPSPVRENCTGKLTVNRPSSSHLFAISQILGDT